MTSEPAAVRDNPSKQRYDIHDGGQLAGFAEYRLDGSRITFTHTQTEPAFNGRGLARQLVTYALDDARRRELTVRPLCPYVRKVITSDPGASSTWSLPRTEAGSGSSAELMWTSPMSDLSRTRSGDGGRGRDAELRRQEERKDLYGARRGDFVIVDVPPLQFLMIDGHGDPNTETAYRAAVEALYTLSYAVRAVAKASLAKVHTVGPLEGSVVSRRPRGVPDPRQGRVGLDDDDRPA
jgi:predicted GNAT family acetyltransferase